MEERVAKIKYDAVRDQDRATLILPQQPEGGGQGVTLLVSDQNEGVAVAINLGTLVGPTGRRDRFEGLGEKLKGGSPSCTARDTE